MFTLILMLMLSSPSEGNRINLDALYNSSDNNFITIYFEAEKEQNEAKFIQNIIQTYSITYIPKSSNKGGLNVLIHHRLTYFTVILLTLTTSACDVSSDTATEPPRYFEFTHQNGENEYKFAAQTSVPDIFDKVEDELSKPLEERTLHIHGPIARGTEEYNGNWSWHFVPDEWDLVEVSAEVCDGTPQMVESDLDYWVDQVGNFCPWSSRVSGEVEVSEE